MSLDDVVCDMMVGSFYQKCIERFGTADINDQRVQDMYVGWQLGVDDITRANEILTTYKFGGLT